MDKKNKIKIASVASIMVLASAVGIAYVSSDANADNKKDVEKDSENNQKERTVLELPPEVQSYEKELEIGLDEKVTLDMLKIQVVPDTDVEYDFTEKSYDTVGTYTETIKVKTIGSDLFTEIEVKINVVDKVSPTITGTKNIVVTEGDAIDLLSGVSASDNVDGDITGSIQVSSYDASKFDVDQAITYTVTDKAGNSASVDIVLHIKSNPIEALDKTMYAISSVNVRDSSSASGNKVGGLSYAQEVHVTGRDKNTGWYRIDYSGVSSFVSGDYLSDTKPVVETPTYTQPSTQQQQPSDCDCSSDCGWVCLDCGDCGGDCCDPATDPDIQAWKERESKDCADCW